MLSLLFILGLIGSKNGSLKRRLFGFGPLSMGFLSGLPFGTDGNLLSCDSTFGCQAISARGHEGLVDRLFAGLTRSN